MDFRPVVDAWRYVIELTVQQVYLRVEAGGWGFDQARVYMSQGTIG